MRVFVTGATGFLGAELVRQLVASGHEVTALVRASSRCDALAGLPVRRHVGDLLAPATLDGALAGCEVLFHAAGLVSYFPRDDRRVWQTNVEGTRTVLDAAQAQSVGRVVYTSSIAALGFATRMGERCHEATVSDVASLGLCYCDAKRAAEIDVLRRVREQGLDAVIVNPAVIFGPGDVNNSSTYLATAVLQRKAPTFVAGAFNVADVEDVARGHLQAAARGRTGERYVLGGDNVETADFLRRIADQGGVWAPAVRVPVWAALVFAVTLGRWWRVVPINPATVRMSARRWVYDLSKAERELGYTHMPLERTIARTIDDLRRRGVVAPT